MSLAQLARTLVLIAVPTCIAGYCYTNRSGYATTIRSSETRLPASKRIGGAIVEVHSVRRMSDSDVCIELVKRQPTKSTDGEIVTFGALQLVPSNGEVPGGMFTEYTAQGCYRTRVQYHVPSSVTHVTITQEAKLQRHITFTIDLVPAQLPTRSRVEGIEVAVHRMTYATYPTPWGESKKKRLKVELMLPTDMVCETAKLALGGHTFDAASVVFQAAEARGNARYDVQFAIPPPSPSNARLLLKVGQEKQVSAVFADLPIAPRD